MIEIEVSRGRLKTKHHLDSACVTVGREKNCDLLLNSWRVAQQHARFLITNQKIYIEDLGTITGTFFNGKRILSIQLVNQNDKISIGPFVLAVTLNCNPESSQSIGLETPMIRSVNTDTKNNISAPSTLLDEADYDTKDTLQRNKEKTQQGSASSFSESNDPLYIEWCRHIHARLIESLDLRRRDVANMSDEVLRQQADQLIVEIIKKIDADLPPSINPEMLRVQVLNEAVGLGPLESLLADSTITEIMVNNHKEIFVEKLGSLEQYPLSFSSEAAVLAVIERIVSPLGRRIDDSSPMVDARLKDGSRVNAIIRPLALKGPALTIRKFPLHTFNPDALVEQGAFSKAMIEFLKLCVKYKKNIVISGGTGSGKTTLLNILSNFIPQAERIITIEDAAELRLNHQHLIALEAKPANAEGRGAISIRDLVRNALRMRPDRIVVGECRGAEAFDMMQAMNTGHEGSLTTLHANSARDALARLETMILMAGMELPLTAIREQITSAIDIVVQQTRFACGSRKVTQIVELTGIESGCIQMQEIFKFYRKGMDSDGKVAGQFASCQLIPEWIETVRMQGIGVDLSIFNSLEDDSLMNMPASVVSG